jgi:hypothetical protein
MPRYCCKRLNLPTCLFVLFFYIIIIVLLLEWYNTLCVYNIYICMRVRVAVCSCVNYAYTSYMYMHYFAVPISMYKYNFCNIIQVE